MKICVVYSNPKYATFYIIREFEIKPNQTPIRTGEFAISDLLSMIEICSTLPPGVILLGCCK